MGFGGREKAERWYLSGERVSHSEKFHQILWCFCQCIPLLLFPIKTSIESIWPLFKNVSVKKIIRIQSKGVWSWEQNLPRAEAKAWWYCVFTRLLERSHSEIVSEKGFGDRLVSVRTELLTSLWHGGDNTDLLRLLRGLVKRMHTCPWYSVCQILLWLRPQGLQSGCMNLTHGRPARATNPPLPWSPLRKPLVRCHWDSLFSELYLDEGTLVWRLEISSYRLTFLTLSTKIRM